MADSAQKSADDTQVELQNNREPDRQTPKDQGELSLWHRCSFHFARGFLLLLAKILTLNGLYQFGKAFGTLEWLINYKRRAKFSQGLKSLLGDRLNPAQRRVATRRHFTRTRCDKIFYLIFDRLPRETLNRLLTIENKEALDRALADYGGAYVAMSHHGPQHIAAVLYCLAGYKVALVRDRKEGKIRQFMQRIYEKTCPEMNKLKICYADDFPREQIRCLQSGYILGSALDIQRDRGGSQKTVDVRYFGQNRPFMAGPIKLALRTGVPVLQGLLRSKTGFHYEVIFTSPIAVVLPQERMESQDSQISKALEQYAANLEAHVTEFPCHITRV